jgi:hypothetical protein
VTLSLIARSSRDGGCTFSASLSTWLAVAQSSGEREKRKQIVSMGKTMLG